MTVVTRTRSATLALLLAFCLAAASVVSGTPADAADDTRSISGVVTLPDDAPLDYWRAVYVRATGASVNGTKTGSVSATDGSYTINGLAPGTYRVQFLVTSYETGGSYVKLPLVDSFWPNKVTWGSAILVDVTAHDATDISTRVQWGGTLAGTVKIEGAPAPAAEGVTVWIYGDRGTLLNAEVNPYTGVYRYRNIPPDNYVVSFSYHPRTSTAPVAAAEFYDNEYNYFNAPKVPVVERGETLGIDALLSKGVWSSTPAPTVVRDGNTLVAPYPEWTPAAAYYFQWLRDGVAIDGETSLTHVLTADDAGTAISLQLTGVNQGFDTVVTESRPVHIPSVFTKSPAPVISGVARSGSTLTARPGTWTPAATSYTYRWYRNGAAISGATKSTYKVTTADRGKKITVKVTGKRAGYTTVTKASAAAIVYKEFAKTITPKISGTAKAGKTLTAIRGTWSPVATYSYQWYRSGVKISGATHKTYKLTSKDKGKKITVKVTGKRSGYLTVTKTSPAKTVAK